MSTQLLCWRYVVMGWLGKLVPTASHVNSFTFTFFDYCVYDILFPRYNCKRLSKYELFHFRGDTMVDAR